MPLSLKSSRRNAKPALSIKSSLQVAQDMVVSGAGPD